MQDNQSSPKLFSLHQKKKFCKDAMSQVHSQYKLSLPEALKMPIFELPDKVKEITLYLQISRSDKAEG